MVSNIPFGRLQDNIECHNNLFVTYECQSLLKIRKRRNKNTNVASIVQKNGRADTELATLLDSWYIAGELNE